MQNKFGVKDFVIVVLVLAVGALVVLAMVQDDRQWNEFKGTQDKVKQIEAQLAQLERASKTANDGIGRRLGGVEASLNAIRGTLAEGVVTRGGAPATGSSDGGGAAYAGDGSDDESWALPDIEIVRAEPWTYSDDPTTDEGFVEGGTFTELFEGQPPKITPYLIADVYGRRVVDLVCESLGWYDARTLKLRGRLAEAWQYDPDGMWLRVKIRDEAMFSNGEPVTAEDVRFTYDDVLFNEEIEAARYRGVYNGLAGVEVISEKVVLIRFKEARFDNIDQAFGFKILPKSVYAAWVESPATFNASTGLCVGSGPFRLERVDPDDQWTAPADIVLVRNERYWGPRAPLSEYRYKVITASLTRFTEYLNGTGDMARPTADQYVSKRSDASFQAENRPMSWYNMRGGYSFIGWQCGPRNGDRLTPFHDVRVRQAMTMLTDRERIIRDIMSGLARVATSPFLSSTPQSDPDAEPWPYDPDEAVRLLREAGWWDRDGDGILENERGDEFRFEITFGSGSEATLKMCEFLRGEYAEAGIVMTLRTIEWSILADIIKRRDFDAITFAWSASAPESDPQQIWHSESIKNEGDNFVQWASDDADALISKGRQTLDYDERMEVWHELHAVFREEQPYTFMFELPWNRFVRSRVGNVEAYESGLEYFEFWMSPEGSAPSF